MDVSLKHITFSRFLAVTNLIVVCLFVAFFLWLKHGINDQAELISNGLIELTTTQPESLNNTTHSLYSDTNIFDISGKHWVLPEKKKTTPHKKISHQYLKENEISGSMVLPSFSGIFVDGKFIRSNSRVKKTQIQKIENGKVWLETPDGEKIYNLQKLRNTNIQFLKQNGSPDSNH